jgi:hypothetical protein
MKSNKLYQPESFLAAALDLLATLRIQFTAPSARHHVLLGLL